MDQNAEIIRLKQKILYYKAELDKYDKKTLELERATQKEIIRNKFLQEKRKAWNAEKDSYIREINKLQQKILELEVSLEEEKQPLSQNDISISHQSNMMNHFLREPYGYFNYSIILPMPDENALTVYGDFHLVNEASVPLEDLIICFKVHPIGTVTFSGKISDPKFIKKTEGSQESIDWIFASEDWKKASLVKGEYWVKPIELAKTKIDRISLKGWELTVPTDLNIRKAKVEAFLYLSKESSPVPSINKINIQIP